MRFAVYTECDTRAGVKQRGFLLHNNDQKIIKYFRRNAVCVEAFWNSKMVEGARDSKYEADGLLSLIHI